MAMQTGNNTEILADGLQEVYYSTLETPDTVYEKIYNVMDTEKKTETDQRYAGFAGYWGIKQEKVDGTFTEVTKGKSKSYTQVVRFGGFEVTWEMRKFDRYDVVMGLPSEMAINGKQTVDYVATLPFNRATNGSYLGNDGVVFASTSHPLDAGGTQSNRLATFATLSRSNVQSAIEGTASWVKHNGLPALANMPYGIMFHPKNILLVNEIFDSTDRPDTGNRAKNVLPTIEKIPNPYLTNTDDWCLLFNAPKQRKLKFFWSQKPGEIDSINMEKGNYDWAFQDIMAFTCDYSDCFDVYFGYHA